MSRSKVTAKYQVTIPKDVRDELAVRPGEVLSVEAISKGEIRLRRFSSVPDPLAVLIGKRDRHEAVRVETLEEKAESR